MRIPRSPSGQTVDVFLDWSDGSWRQETFPPLVTGFPLVEGKPGIVHVLRDGRRGVLRNSCPSLLDRRGLAGAVYEVENEAGRDDGDFASSERIQDNVLDDERNAGGENSNRRSKQSETYDVCTERWMVAAVRNEHYTKCEVRKLTEPRELQDVHVILRRYL